MDTHVYARIAVFLAVLLCRCVAEPCVGSELPGLEPPWLLQAIAKENSSAHPGSFEEATYEGRRVFEFIRGDRAHTGDERILYSEDGKEICKFGGLVGHVTSGSCSIEKIIYVRTIYSRAH